MDNNKQQYWYVFNDKEMADAITRATGEHYRVFGRSGEGIVFSFKKTEKVLTAYMAAKEYRKLLAK